MMRWRYDTDGMLNVMRTNDDAMSIAPTMHARAGPHGGSVKPYRATGRSWNVSIPLTGDASDLSAFEAFRNELASAGPESVLATARFFLHADEATFDELEQRLTAIAREYVDTDEQRRDAGHPIVNGFMIFHRVAEPESTHVDRAAPRRPPSGDR